MNRYQVILSNNDVLQILADGVATARGPGGFDYLYFYETVLDDVGNPKTANDGQELEVVKVAEFAAWNGWNFVGVFNPPEVAPKDVVAGVTPVAMEEALRAAIQATGKS